MNRWSTLCGAALSLCLCMPAHGDGGRRITAIVFEGNDVTRDEVLAREVGDVFLVELPAPGRQR
jgi:hypothetical protein